MSQRYTVGCSTPVPHACVFLSPCSVPWSSTSSPATAKFPSPTQFSFPHPCQTLLCADIAFQIHKVLRLLQFLPSHLQAKLLVFFSQKLAFCLLYAYLHAHFLAHLCDFCQRLL